MSPITGQDYDNFVADHAGLTWSGIPPWGAVTKWGDRYVLVYFVPDTHKLFLTDVTDNKNVIANMPETFDRATLSMWYYLPQELMNTVAKDYQAIAEVASTATSPSTLIPLAVIAVVVAVVLFRR